METIDNYKIFIENPKDHKELIFMISKLFDRSKASNIMSEILENLNNERWKDFQSFKGLEINYQNFSMGNVDVIKKMEFLGMTIPIQYDEYNTPLILAVKNGHIDIIDYLLEKKVDIHWKDYMNRDALYYACSNGNIDAVLRLLNINEKIGDSRCIFCCLKNTPHSLDILKLLVIYGANLNIVTRSGANLLMLAIKNGRTDISKYLISLGVDTNFTDNYDNNALFYARKYENHEIIKCLNEIHII